MKLLLTFKNIVKKNLDKCKKKSLYQVSKENAWAKRKYSHEKYISIGAMVVLRDFSTHIFCVCVKLEN